MGRSSTPDSLTLVDPYIDLPKMLTKPPVTYPDSVKLKNPILVYVGATVDTVGRLSAVSLARPTNTVFDALAIDLAYKFKFSPGHIDGRPSVMRISWAIEFTPKH